MPRFDLFTVIILILILSLTISLTIDIPRVYIVLHDGSIELNQSGYCKFGVVLNSFGNNILGQDGLVLRCSGTVELTKEQAMNYE